MDQFDRAQALEAAEREAILQGKRGESERQASFSLSHCEDCGEPIEAKRQALVKGVKRCIACQQDFEEFKRRGLA